jgi:ABC-type transporter Mla maintaining outer membrane lipid asymmetry ATPase subunit MlaF
MPQKGNLLQHVHESRKIGIIKEVLMNKAITLLTDIPEKDLLFGFDKYASVLTSAIMGTEPHFTMGIFGGWGCGKTTLLRRMEAQLKAYDITFTEYVSQYSKKRTALERSWR